MEKIFYSHRSGFVLLSIISCVFILIQCINNEKEKEEKKGKNDKTAYQKKVSFQQFAGSATCMKCHKNIYNEHLHTGHFLTSQPANEKNIKGSFAKGKNIFPFSPNLYMEMEKRDSGLYQVVYQDGVERLALRFDIVIGSGAKGQTYLTWKKNELSQLPVSYLTSANEWANSPGYPNQIAINRPITLRCMECHSTYATNLPALNKSHEEIDHNQIIYGIDCEKCHGPAEKHVEYQTLNPKATEAKYIINPSSLTRAQNLDLCALCHGGRLQKTKPSFEFQAGARLSDYFVANTSGPITKDIDVHGNQYGLLKESKCFRMSETLTCATCHSPHENERGKTTLFSQRCMTCHNQEHGTFCKINSLSKSSIKKNCIDCHMPKQPSMSIALLLPGNAAPTAALIHTHLIKVYPDETKKVIAYWKKAN